MWVYYLSDLPLESHENLPQSLQEVLLTSNVQRSSTHISTRVPNYGEVHMQVIKQELLLEQSEQV